MHHRPILLASLLLLAACDSSQDQPRPAAPPAPVAMPKKLLEPAPAPPGATVPFTTCEAEAPGNATNGGIVRMSTATSALPPEGEASGYGYVALEKTGDYLEFPQVPAANALVIRHCIPDAPEGGGITATLGLYVNGERRQSLQLSSQHNWLYGSGKLGENGQSNQPTAFPHVFWDETRCFISGGVKAGDRIRLQKDAGDTAAFYRIDLIDVELVPDPLPQPPGSLSVADFGAAGVDAATDTTAIRACIAAAKAAGKTVWFPAGDFLQNASFQLDGVRVQGAGMWHTRLAYTVVPEKWTGVFSIGGDGASVGDLAIDGPLTQRKGPLHGFTGAGRRWSVRNVWVSHTNTAFWMAGDDGLVAGCRVRFTYADGININNGSRLSTHRVVVEDNHIRGCGDDSIAILCHAPAKDQNLEDRQTEQVTVRHNTAIAPWWAACCDLAGGTGHLIEDNLFEGAGLVINLPGAYPMQPQGSAIIRRNLLQRCGNDAAGQQRGALWIYAGSTAIAGVVIEDNRIIRPWFKGIDLQGSQPQNIIFRRNCIEHPGGDAIVAGKSAKGSGVFEGNSVIGLGGNAVPIRNQAGTAYTVSELGNSWP